MCSFNGLILPNDPDVSVGCLCPSLSAVCQSLGLLFFIFFFFTVTSSDLKFLQTLDENGVPAVLCLCYCPRFLADIYLVSNVGLIY